MNITWRSEIRKSDLAVIRKIVADSGVFSPEEIDVAVELAEDALTRGAKSDYHFLFGDIDKKLAGYTCFGRIPMTDERYDLYWIVVDKNLTQCGIASELQTRTETLIREIKGKALYAETSSRAVYAPAHAFYLKQGYAELARLKDFYSNGDDKIIFGKFF